MGELRVTEVKDLKCTTVGLVGRIIRKRDSTKCEDLMICFEDNGVISSKVHSLSFFG